ncbi:MAG: hypothetical protein M1817_005879 [Caeruleum heppii]|nr:MAG: hypothetical protein M1817_005879 [Caeruleum heppii]
MLPELKHVRRRSLSRMRARGCHFAQLAVWTLICIVLGTTLRTLYQGDSRLSTHSFPVPTVGLKWTSWQQSPSTAFEAEESPQNGTEAVPTLAAQEEESDASDATSGPVISPPESAPLENVEASAGPSVDDELAHPEDTTPATEDDHAGEGEAKALTGPPILAKVTILFGDVPTYERAVKTHEVQNTMYGYPINILRHGILDDVWTKPAYILALLLEQLAKPVEERLKWLFWFDADTVMMNPSIPIEAFLPPEELPDIHLLVTNDFNGLNNGVFPIRVHPWSVELMSAVIASRVYAPEADYTFRDQSALSDVLKRPRFRQNVAYVPQRWFNAYDGGNSLTDKIEPYQIRRGDMLVHFAGLGNREERMKYHMDIAEQHLPDWELDLFHTSYPSELREFWAKKYADVQEEKSKLDAARDTAQKVMQETQKNLERFKEALREDECEKIDQRLQGLRKVANAQALDIDALHQKQSDLQGACSSLQRLVDEARTALLERANKVIAEAEQAAKHAPHPRLHEFMESVTSELQRLQMHIEQHLTDEPAVNGAIDALRTATARLAHQRQRVDQEDAEAERIREAAEAVAQQAARDRAGESQEELPREDHT